MSITHQEYGTILIIEGGTTVIEADDGTLYASPSNEHDTPGEMLELAFALPLERLPTEKRQSLAAAVAALDGDALAALREGVSLYG